MAVVCIIPKYQLTTSILTCKLPLSPFQLYPQNQPGMVVVLYRPLFYFQYRLDTLVSSDALTNRAPLNQTAGNDLPYQAHDTVFRMKSGPELTLLSCEISLSAQIQFFQLKNLSYKLFDNQLGSHDLPRWFALHNKALFRRLQNLEDRLKFLSI